MTLKVMGENSNKKKEAHNEELMQIKNDKINKESNESIVAHRQPPHIIPKNLLQLASLNSQLNP